MLGSKLQDRLDAMDQVNLTMGFDPYDPDINLEQHTGQVLQTAESIYHDLQLSLDELRGSYISNGRIIRKTVINIIELTMLSVNLNMIKILMIYNNQTSDKERELELRIHGLSRKIHFLKHNFIDNNDCIEALDGRIKCLILKSEYINKILKIYEKEELIYDKQRVLSKEVG